MSEIQKNSYDQISPKWRERFQFFDAHGAPKTKEFKQAVKAQSFGKKIMLTVNFWAFFFGFIFFFVTGMWKKGVTLLCISISLFIVAFIFGTFLSPSMADALSRGLGFAYAFTVGFAANYAYYLKSVKDNDSWNPFEGLGA